MSVAYDYQTVSLVSDLISRSERRRIDALGDLPPGQQGELGQFFTPDRAATLIANQFTLPETGRVRVLDPGAGSGSLSSALVARILLERPTLKVDLVGIEVDSTACLHLRNTIRDIRETAAAVGCDVATDVIEQDFIEAGSGLLNRHSSLEEPFDLIIMNPPYRKLAAASLHRKTLLAHGIDCPNLYAAFIALSVNMLTPLGQLVAITPRSFANGPYFSQFRRFMLDRVTLNRIHTFESRSTVFSDTGVLQENIIFAASRGGPTGAVTLSTSVGHVDQAVARAVCQSEVVRPDDPHRFIRIPSNEADTAVAERMGALPAHLSDLGLKVSTGKVVDFRAKDRLLTRPSGNSVPLIYPGNVRNGTIQWPRDIRKSQAFRVESPNDSKKYLMPAGFYVVVKRFSAKEERRRVVAAVWDPSGWNSEIAFENHVNIFHASSVGLERDLAIGLSYWLNSSLVDSFFRTFSGHTQVNATDLRSLQYPSAGALRTIGHGRNSDLPDQAEIDDIVEATIDTELVGIPA